MRRRLALALTVAVLGGAAAPALATHTTDPKPVFNTQAVWLHDGGKHFGNAALANQDPKLTFTTTKPTTSVTGGAGGIYVSDSASELALGDFGPSGPAFTGTFTGDIDTLTVDLYALSPWAQANKKNLSVRHRLTVDGTALYASEEASDVVTAAGGNAVQVAKFAYTNIYDAMKGAGLTVGPGQLHTVKLQALVYYFGTETAWLYDTSEVPSGMVFNALKTDGYTGFDLAPPADEE